MLGSATASPYTYSWTNAAVGSYNLTAKVTDSQSLTQTSSPVSVQVKAAVTSPPTISLSPAVNQSTQTAPANGTFVAPAGISLAATAAAVAGSTISKVEFYQGATLIGTATVPTAANGNSYSINWSNVTANSYSITAKATDNKNATATTAAVTVNVINNNTPTVSLTASPKNATAPATIILNATAADSDGTIAKVEFLNGTNSIATVTQAPYKTNWENVVQGSYSLTAKATDNLGATTTSAVVPVAVTKNAPKMYDIHADHLNTPRVITDSSGTEVWRWDSAPFGETAANEEPMQATGKFTFNFRFPGQYWDAETGLHYNYFRDYDPASGRYVESDPIGLVGGINTFTYVDSNSLSFMDSYGLKIEPAGTPADKIRINKGIADLVRMSKSAAEMIEIIKKSKRVITIELGCKNQYGTDKNGDPKPGNLVWDPNKDHNYDGSEPWHFRPPEIILGHELIHAWIDISGIPSIGNSEMEKVGYEEWGVVGAKRKKGLPNANYPYTENKFRKECGCAKPRERY